MTNKYLLGSHVSMSKPEYLLGSAQEAFSYGAKSFMVYLGAPQNTLRTPMSSLRIDEYTNFLEKVKIDKRHVIVHAPYIVNPASPEIEKRDFAKSFLTQETLRAERMGAKYLVIHPGNYLKGPKEEALARCADTINYIHNKTHECVICLETMSGKGTEIGISFSELKIIIDNVDNKKRIGVCADTCHMHDSGIDIRDVDHVLKQFDEIVGLKYLKVMHVNDSQNQLGGKKDRHENIGKGHIGLATIAKWVKHKSLLTVPKILETPWEDSCSPYKKEIELILQA